MDGSIDSYVRSMSAEMKCSLHGYLSCVCAVRYSWMGGAGHAPVHLEQTSLFNCVNTANIPLMVLTKHGGVISSLPGVLGVCRL